MPAVDRNVLRAAIAELLGFPDTPVPVVINESLEIARRYSAPESLNFLNGVLDAIARHRKSRVPWLRQQWTKTNVPSFDLSPTCPKRRHTGNVGTAYAGDQL